MALILVTCVVPRTSARLPSGSSLVSAANGRRAIGTLVSSGSKNSERVARRRRPGRRSARDQLPSTSFGHAHSAAQSLM